MIHFRQPLSRRPVFFCSEGEPPAPAPGGAPQPPAPAPAPAPALPQPAVRPGETAEQAVTRLNNEIGNVRAEAAAHRIGERTAREQVTALETRIAAVPGEIETRVAATRQEYEPRVQTLTTKTIDAELRAAALAAGLADADLLPLIDRTGVAMDPQTLVVTGIPEAIAKFKTAKPSYFREVNVQLPPARTPTGHPAPAPAPSPGGPGPTSVVGMDKAAYGDAKRAALRALR